MGCNEANNFTAIAVTLKTCAFKSLALMLEAHSAAFGQVGFFYYIGHGVNPALQRSFHPTLSDCVVLISTNFSNELMPPGVQNIAVGVD